MISFTIKDRVSEEDRKKFEACFGPGPGKMYWLTTDENNEIKWGELNNSANDKV